MAGRVTSLRRVRKERYYRRKSRKSDLYGLLYTLVDTDYFGDAPGQVRPQ